jgi:tetratricopeptide (TPR) repeat protein
MNKRSLIIAIACLVVGIYLGFALSVGMARHREQRWIRDAQRMVNAWPQDAGKWTMLGNAKNFAGDSAGALVAYKRALELDPANVEAMQGVGMHYLRKGDAETAREWFSKSLVVAERSRPDAVYHTRSILEFIDSMKNGR